jgi:hyperosmotically inducible periplasmic protein
MRSDLLEERVMMNRPVAHSPAAIRASSAEGNLILQQQPICEAISDGVITARVRSELLSHARTARYDIRVNTVCGIVELSGFAETTAIAGAAALLAQNVEGVQDVTDMMDVRSAD